jgi:hypothetical protein
MKKFLAFTAAILFVGVISLSILAFTDDIPKKQKTETATAKQCENQKEATTGTTETKACCAEAGKTATGECPKAAECKNHSEKTADAK